MSPDRLIREAKLAVGKEALRRQRVYLDTKYWLLLRDAQRGSPTNPGSLELLEVLAQGVAAGRLVCPLEGSVLREVLKQTDASTQASTVALIDQLSDGVGLSPFEERVRAELLYFFYRHGLKAANLYHPKQLVWCRLAFLFGTIPPPIRAGDPPEVQAALMAAFEDIGRSTLSSILATMNDAPPSTDYGTLAGRLDADKDRHSHELKSYRDAYSTELAGLLELFDDTISGALEYLFRARYGRRVAKTEKPDQSVLASFRGLLRAALLRGSIDKDELSYFHITASLYADYRWNRARRLRANDIIDFAHAAAALPYCGTFLTERRLANTLCATHLSMDQRYGTKVLWEPRAAVQHIRSLAS